jgi:GGDEF domain-containing protein
MSVMGRRIGLWYTLFSIVALIALAFVAVSRLNTARSLNLDAARASYLRLRDEVTEAIVSDASVRDVVRTYSAAMPDVLAVVLFSPERGVRYVWPAQADIVSFSGPDLAEVRGFPTFNVKEISQTRVSRRLELPEDSDLYLDAVYTVLSSEDAYLPLRDSLIAVLAFAFATLIVALAVNAINRSRAEASDAEADRQVVSETRRKRPSEHTHNDTGRLGPPRPRVPRPTEEVEPGYREPAPEPILEEVELEEIAADPGEPGTLFSATTGLSYRDHLERRLGLELERAAYNDQDLTCMMIRFDDMGDSQEAYVERAGQILSTFQFEDLCFEYDHNSFCVILPNTPLPQGLRAAEDFRGRYKGRIVIGLSARNGRLVEASRVLHEACRSMEHATRDRRGIVGFRPDPRKYRQFISGQMGAD